MDRLFVTRAQDAVGDPHNLMIWIILYKNKMSVEIQIKWQV